MRPYANADVDEQRYKTSKTQVSLTFCKLWSWSNRNWPLIRSALEWLVLQSGTAPVVPAGAAASGRATVGTTRAVPNCSTNHSSAYRIVVNSYNSSYVCSWMYYRAPTRERIIIYFVLLLLCSPITGICYAISQNNIIIRLSPSHWETSLQSNAVSHWLDVNLESSLILINYTALSIIQSGMHHNSPGRMKCVVYGCYRITV